MAARFELSELTNMATACSQNKNQSEAPVTDRVRIKPTCRRHLRGSGTAAENFRVPPCVKHTCVRNRMCRRKKTERRKEARLTGMAEEAAT